MVIFNDRREAGKILAQEILQLKAQWKDTIVLGIPRGGVAIGYYIAKAIGVRLDALVLRKLPIPDNPEAGFGAVTLDKVAIFNEKLLAQIYLTQGQINRIIDSVYKEVVRRNSIYRRDKPFPDLKGNSVILADDGLATGFTMLAAVRFARKKNAREVIVAAPVAHEEAYQIVIREVDKAIVLQKSDLPYFAVASFYRDFSEMQDKEVISYLEDKVAFA